MQKHIGIAVILLVIGLLAGAFSIYTYLDAHTFIQTAQKTEGTVIDLKLMMGTGSKGGTTYTYSPVVEFKTPDGQTHTFTSNQASNPPSFKRGDIVPIYIDPANPEFARIGTFWQLWFAPICTAIIALGFLLAAIQDFRGKLKLQPVK